MKKSIIFLLGLAVFLSVFLNLFQKQISPPGFDADEAAFGYNAYSLLKTGRDEYGTFLPLRLKSFGDYKLPLYSYLSVPFVAVFGLNEFSTRFLNTLVALLLPIIFFFLAKQLFHNDKVAVGASFLVSIVLGLHIVGRQAHEGYLAFFFLSAALYFFIKALDKGKKKDLIILLVLSLFALFSYQASRIVVVSFLIYAIGYWLATRTKAHIALALIFLLMLFSLTDILYKPERVKNLFFVNSPGFSLTINELRGEGGEMMAYNKLTMGLHDVLLEHMKYFSPNFLVIQGDENTRFGFLRMGPLTPIEYIFIFIGIYFLFKKKERWRYLLVSLAFMAPFGASLSWAGVSLTRSLFLFVPLILLSAYGFVELFLLSRGRWVFLIFGCILFLEAFFLYYSWDFYLNHYPKRALAQRSWQVGYVPLTAYISKQYNNFDTFYITRKNGQPYIFLLFYMQYPPEKYQKEASISKADEYGFGQIEKFDKFDFNFTISDKKKKVVLIGYPDDFQGVSSAIINPERIKKITAQNEEIFWIDEVK